MNDFVLQHFDRDTHHVGNHIVVLSAGTAVLEVNAMLVKITKKRMMDSGGGCDLVCVGRPPPHRVPLLVIHSNATVTDDDPSVGKCFSILRMLK